MPTADSAIPTQVRVRTDPEDGLAYRYEAIQAAREALGEGNKTDAIVAACDHAAADRRAKQRALEYLAEEVPAPVVEDVAELLSTDQLELSADHSVTVGGE